MKEGKKGDFMEAIWTPQPKPLMMSRPEYEALYGGAAGSGKTDYLVKDNVPVWGKFEYINGRWYAFDNAGFMIKGWFKTDEGWYYLGADGVYNPIKSFIMGADNRVEIVE